MYIANTVLSFLLRGAVIKQQGIASVSTKHARLVEGLEHHMI